MTSRLETIIEVVMEEVEEVMEEVEEIMEVIEETMEVIEDIEVAKTVIDVEIVMMEGVVIEKEVGVIWIEVVIEIVKIGLVAVREIENENKDDPQLREIEKGEEVEIEGMLETCMPGTGEKGRDLEVHHLHNIRKRKRRRVRKRDHHLRNQKRKIQTHLPGHIFWLFLMIRYKKHLLMK